MKRIILSFMALIFAVSSFAQSTVETINSPKAMKPIIMVIPEKAWCINQGFVKDNDPKVMEMLTQGRTTTRNHLITKRHFSMMTYSM